MKWTAPFGAWLLYCASNFFDSTLPSGICYIERRWRDNLGTGLVKMMSGTTRAEVHRQTWLYLNYCTGDPDMLIWPTFRKLFEIRVLLEATTWIFCRKYKSNSGLIQINICRFKSNVLLGTENQFWKIIRIIMWNIAKNIKNVVKKILFIVTYVNWKVFN